MPNQDNYPDKLTSFQDIRPSRIEQKDLDIIQETNLDGSPRQSNVVFGITNRDVVELYVYDDLNQIVAHTNIRPTDDALRLIAFASNQVDPVGVGQDLTPDFLQMDLVEVLNRLELSPSRYAVTLNYFRDEVGKEYEWDNLEEEKDNRGLQILDGRLYRSGSVSGTGEEATLTEGATPVSRLRGNRLFISDISPSRTELRLKAVDESYELTNQIREFVEPSLPKFVAQAVVDQTLGVRIQDATLELYGIPKNSIQEFETITFTKVESNIFNSPAQLEMPDNYKIVNRLTEANLHNEFFIAYQEVIFLARDKIIEVLAENSSDIQVQENELIEYVRTGVHRAIIEAVGTGVVDLRLGIYDSDYHQITSVTTEQEL